MVAGESMLADPMQFVRAMVVSPDGFSVWDAVRAPSGAIVDFEARFLNRSASDLLNRTPQDIVGVRCRDAFPDSADHLVARWAEAVERAVAHLASLVQGIDLTPGAAPADQQLAACVLAVVDFLQQRDDLTKLLLVVAPRDPVLRPMVEGLFDHVRWMMRAALEDGHARVGGSQVDANHILCSHLIPWVE